MLKFECLKCNSTITEEDLVCPKCGYENDINAINQLELVKAQNQVTEVAGAVRKLSTIIQASCLAVGLILCIIGLALFLDAIDLSEFRTSDWIGNTLITTTYIDWSLVRIYGSTATIIFIIGLSFSQVTSVLLSIFLPRYAYKKISCLNINMPYFIYTTTLNQPKHVALYLDYISLGVIIYDTNKLNGTTYVLLEIVRGIINFTFEFLLFYCVVDIIYGFAITHTFIIYSPLRLVLFVASIIAKILYSTLTKRLSWNKSNAEEDCNPIVSKEDIESFKRLNQTEKDIKN